nr:hypothetical protein [Tanacetum cinerariifolium]
RKNTKLPQTSVPTEVVADEVVYEEMYDSVVRAATTATGLDAEQDMGIISKTQFTTTLNEPSFIRTSLGNGPRCQKTMRDAALQTRSERVSKIYNDLPLSRVKTLRSGEDRLEPSELIELYEASLGDQEDASKQGRIIDNLDTDEGVTLEVSTADPVTTAGEVVTTAGVEVSTAATTPIISMDDITLAKALAALKSAKPMVKELNHELAERLQAKEKGELTTEERLELFVELMNERKKHFTRLRAEEKKRKPPTKAQKKKQMCNYLKNMAGFTHNQLKNKSFKEVQKDFENTMSWINSFVPMEKVVEVEEDNDQEEAEIKMYIKIIFDDEIALDVIPLAIKPLIINIEREDLETLWKLVKAKYRNIRPEEAYERVLWGDMKVMFEPDIESEAWRNLQGNKVTV